MPKNLKDIPDSSSVDQGLSSSYQAMSGVLQKNNKRKASDSTFTGSSTPEKKSKKSPGLLESQKIPSFLSPHKTRKGRWTVPNPLFSPKEYDVGFTPSKSDNRRRCPSKKHYGCTSLFNRASNSEKIVVLFTNKNTTPNRAVKNLLQKNPSYITPKHTEAIESNPNGSVTKLRSLTGEHIFVRAFKVKLHLSDNEIVELAFFQEAASAEEKHQPPVIRVLPEVICDRLPAPPESDIQKIPPTEINPGTLRRKHKRNNSRDNPTPGVSASEALQVVGIDKAGENSHMMSNSQGGGGKGTVWAAPKSHNSMRLIALEIGITKYVWNNQTAVLYSDFVKLMSDAGGIFPIIEQESARVKDPRTGGEVEIIFDPLSGVTPAKQLLEFMISLMQATLSNSLGNSGKDQKTDEPENNTSNAHQSVRRRLDFGL